MKKLSKAKYQAIGTYQFSKSFYVDIVKVHDDGNDIDVFEAYLFNKNYGIKEMLFGIPTDSVADVDAFVDMVESSLVNENYIEEYEEDYCD